ncbi:MAG: SigE family RNA polymerase sigma factor [Propionibacteriaceae bacterium]
MKQPSTVAAVRDLYERHYVHLVRLAVLLTSDVGRAEEIVQDAFVDLVTRWRTIRDPGAASSYLRTCVANRARSHLRHRAVVNRQPVSPPSQANSAETEALVQIEHERVLSVLSDLPGRQREVLILRYYGQLSEAEIAEALGISRGAVKTHSSRGLHSLRAAMEVNR